MPPETTQSIKKRLPACDSCKLRRIRCFPVPPPDACSCCKAKDIVCTTTPVVRKKPTYRSGKRIEIAKQKFGTVNYASTSAADGGAPTSDSAHIESASPSSTVEGSALGSASTSSTAPPSFVPSHDAYPSSASPPTLATSHPVIISIPSSDAAESSAARNGRSSRSPNDALSHYHNYAHSPLPYISAESGLVNTEFSGALLADLLYLYTRVPRSRFLPCISLIASFELAGRRLGAIPPVSQTLVLTVAALTARLSSNPVLFGGGQAPPALSSIYFNPHLISAEVPSEWGRRREVACEKLREMAIEKAWSLRVINESSPQSLAICFILQFLADNLDSASDRRTWATAFAQQLRVMFERNAAIGSDAFSDGPVGHAITKSLFSPRGAIPIFSSAPHGEPDTLQQTTSVTQLRLANAFAPPELYPNIGIREDPLGVAFVREPNIRDMGLRWCLHIMRESIISASRGEICVFTMHDEIMLVGPPPPSPEEVVASVADEIPWWDFGSFLLLVRPFTYRATQLALESRQWQTRRLNGHPFSTSRLEEHLFSLAPLYTLLSVAQARYSNIFTREALAARYQALHQATPNMPHDERNLRFWSINRNILFGSRLFLTAMKSALGSLSIPIYLDLQARIRHLESETQVGSGSYHTASQKQEGDDVHQLTALLGRLRTVLLPYAREVVHDIQWGSNLGWITHLGNEPMKVWCSIILDSVPIEDGGEGVTRAQRVASLETLLNIFKILTWSWPRVFDDPLVQRTQQVVEEQIRNGVYGSGSMVDHTPRSSFGLGAFGSKDKYDTSSDQYHQGQTSPSALGTEHEEDSGIWPSYLGSDEARRVMAPIAAVSLKTTHHADAIPPMPWPKVHSIPPVLGVPDIQQMLQGLSLHDTPVARSTPSGSPPPTVPSTSAPLDNTAFDLTSLDIAEVMLEGTFDHGDAPLQAQAPAPVQMPMADFSEFDMAFFDGPEGLQELSIPQLSFEGYSPPVPPESGFDMHSFAYPQPSAGWTD